MRRTLLHIAILAAALTAVVSCDFLRTVAGRPTSVEIDAKREILAQQEAERAAERARIEAEKAAVQKHIDDSTAALADLKAAGIRITHVSQLKVRLIDRPTHKYCLIVGAFSQPGNASALIKRIKTAGYEAGCMQCARLGLLVYVCPSDDFLSFASDVARVRQEKFCPADCWILTK